MTAALEDRVTSLEVRMDEQERLRASQDRDLSGVAEKLRAQDGLLRALRDTQSEQTQTLAKLAERVDRLDGKVDRLGVSVDGLKGGVTQIIGMLDTLIEHDER